MDITDFSDLLTENLHYTILVVAFVVLCLSFLPKMDLISDKVSKYFMVISAFLLIILSFMVTEDVFARKLFHAGSIAVQELEWHFFDVIFLFGIAYTMSHDKHVRVDIFYDKFPLKVKAIIQIVTILFFVVPLATLIATEAISFVYMSYTQGESSGDPGGLCCRWIIKSSMIWAFLVVLIQSAGELKKAYHKLKVV